MCHTPKMAEGRLFFNCINVDVIYCQNLTRKDHIFVPPIPCSYVVYLTNLLLISIYTSFLIFIFLINYAVIIYYFSIKNNKLCLTNIVFFSFIYKHFHANVAVRSCIVLLSSDSCLLKGNL